MAHLLAWQEIALRAAKELAVNDTSDTFARVSADWDARGGEVVNAEIESDWAMVPMTELRDRFATQPGELRGYLTVVPETRWLKHAKNLESFREESIEHYEDHADDLGAILAAAGAGDPPRSPRCGRGAVRPRRSGRAADDGSVTWARGDQVFAAVSADGTTASFLLDPLVAGAAARTPDVRASITRARLGRPEPTGRGRARRRPRWRLVPVQEPAARSGYVAVNRSREPEGSCDEYASRDSPALVVGGLVVVLLDHGFSWGRRPTESRSRSADAVVRLDVDRDFAASPKQLLDELDTVVKWVSCSITCRSNPFLRTDTSRIWRRTSRFKRP